MKIHKLFPIVLLFFFANAHSQQKLAPDAAARAKQVTEWMKTNLKLTDEQVPQVETLNYKCAQKNVELQKSPLSKKQRQQYLLSNEQYRDTEMRKILSEDQYRTYEERKKEMMKKMKDMI